MTRFGLMSTFPPTICGLATFTAALTTELSRGTADKATVVRVVDAAENHTWAARHRSQVSAELHPGRPESAAAAAAALDACDVAIVQHEYGIYGGPDGDEIVPLLQRLSVPVIVVLHTVLPVPTPSQRAVLEAVCAASSSIVVMSDNAAAVLSSVYQVNTAKVSVIPHGVALQPRAVSVARRVKRVVTWGLMSEGKGLEWGIRAVALLRDLGVPVEYVISGRTHPKVLEREGERYRHGLKQLVAELALEDAVTIEGRYLSPRELDRLRASADVVLLPYLSQEQATSGVLAEAVAAGIPVVSTRFPHAIELLSGGAGLLVDHADPASIAEALRRIVTSDDVARAMHESGLRDAHAASWPAVADRYRLLAASLAAVDAA
jgi:glycosyltransferase involved in cell wall biosynthesis